MVRQTKVQKWREENRDNPSAWKELVALALSTARTGEKIKEIYGFSWNAIRPDCVELGYYIPKREGTANDSSKNTNESKHFSIGDWVYDAQFVSRSIELEKNIRKRLESFEDRNKVYTKKYILNQLLDEILSRYDA